MTPTASQQPGRIAWAVIIRSGACSAHEDCQYALPSRDRPQPDRRPDRHHGSAACQLHRTGKHSDHSHRQQHPADVLKLVYIDGQPRVTLGDRGGAVESGGGKRLSPSVRREPLSQAITAIPYDVIASFMGRPTLLDGDQVRNAPYVVAMRDGHVIGAVGNEIYAKGIGSAAADARYSIIHVDEKLIDPETNDLLGYSGSYVGSGPVATTGDPAKILLTDSTREALQGDKLFPESVDVNVDFIPHAPTSDIKARVIGARDHTVMGQYTVIALNRGQRAGLEAGAR